MIEEFLAISGISTLTQQRKSWANMLGRTRHAYVAALKVIMPDDADGLWEALKEFGEVKSALGIDRFHVTSAVSKLQNERATKVFILTKCKRRYIYICLQFYSSITCFVWKPEHFEFQSYGGA